ncbi:hypothetical protein CNMCM8927_001236 [Aspergillus lentulus]|uniref:Tryptophan synthase beta chain-like PALP domain-containing protein n=2 Tax=Aspergillus lentulus TaxID=293939 RepID=A0AAN5YHL9_ASPLE|nr:hypothetical protein CNMCM7927_007416 [Aspergillus lentulus]KAF4201692.1 hypothetical protein CNMCM8927_001236 [Aspergillus lentulus]
MTDFVQKTHRAPYEEINPRLPNLSQQRRTILITGGSSGIGFAIARAFALADADRVIILGRREAAVTEAVSSLRSELPSSFQGQISGRVCDISDQAHIDDLWDQLARDNVDVDVVVLNAASFSQVKPVLDLGVDTLLADYRVNVLAPYRFAQRLSRQNASKKKYLINVSTIAIHNFDMAPNNLNYGASKNAAALLLQLIARDVPPSDLQIVSFHPGAVLTETARSHGYDENTLPWDDVWAASDEAEVLHGRFVHASWDVTELQSANTRALLDNDHGLLRIGVNGLVLFKAENFQRTGSFKLRGAMSKLSASSASGKNLITASSGNHGIGAACAAQTLGRDLTVVLPENVVPAKLEKIKSTHAKALATLARLSKRDPPRHPSRRTPDQESRHNLADRVEKALKEAGLRTWGFPIYRCTYQNDSDWAELLDRYRWHISDMLKNHNGLDMLHSFQTTVFEHRALFEGASTATIREHFQKWATTAIQEESGGSPDMIRYSNVEAARYRFCLFVDEESLQSVLQAPIDDCLNKDASLNMLHGWWKPESIEDFIQEGLEDVDNPEDLLDDGYDPVGGCTLKDVGWMKVALCDAGLEGFQEMGKAGAWERLYERPQEICYNISNFHARR